MNTFVRLIFGGLEAAATATQNLVNEVMIAITSSVLSAATSMMDLALSVVIDFDSGIHSHCTIGASVVDCANSTELNWFSITYTRVVVVSAVVLVGVAAVMVGKAAIFGGTSSVLAVGLGRLPQAILMMIFVVPATILGLQVVDVASRIIAPDSDATLAVLSDAFDDMGTRDIARTGAHSIILIFVGAMAAIGSLLVWLWLLFRTVAIYVLLAIFGFIAITNVTGGRAAVQRWAKLMIVLVFSKLLIVTVMTLGLTAALSVGEVGQAFGQQAIEVAPPPTIDGEELDEEALERFEEASLGAQAVYQLVTGGALVWLAMFSPFLLMRILPDTWESMGRVEYGTASVRSATRQRAARQVHRVRRRIS